MRKKPAIIFQIIWLASITDIFSDIVHSGVLCRLMPFMIDILTLILKNSLFRIVLKIFVVNSLSEKIEGESCPKYSMPLAATIMIYRKNIVMANSMS